MRQGIIQAPQVLPIAIRIGGAGTDQYQAAMQEPKLQIYAGSSSRLTNIVLFEALQGSGGVSIKLCR